MSTYNINDVVEFNGSSYVSLINGNTGIPTPPFSSNWALMSQAGTSGTDGTSGVSPTVGGLDNEVLTSDGSGGITSETNLTFNGFGLTLVGATSINGNSAQLSWRGGNTFYGGGDGSLSGWGHVNDEGVTSVNNGIQLDTNWTTGYYNGTILTNQQVGGNNVNAGELLVMRNGAWEQADADFAANSTNLLGICLNNTGAEQTVLPVLLEGQISTIKHDQLGTSIPGLPLYISPTTGNVTETAPTASGQYVRLIGHNLYNNTDVVVIRFDPDNFWVQL